MSIGAEFVKILRANGFKKMSWDKCPQGFKEKNYPCYSNESKNIYAEVYTTDKPAYMWIIGPDIGDKKYPGGKHFWESKDLVNLLVATSK